MVCGGHKKERRCHGEDEVRGGYPQKGGEETLAFAWWEVREPKVLFPFKDITLSDISHFQSPF